MKYLIVKVIIKHPHKSGFSVISLTNMRSSMYWTLITVHPLVRALDKLVHSQSDTNLLLLGFRYPAQCRYIQLKYLDQILKDDKISADRFNFRLPISKCSGGRNQVYDMTSVILIW